MNASAELQKAYAEFGRAAAAWARSIGGCLICQGRYRSCLFCQGRAFERVARR